MPTQWLGIKQQHLSSLNTYIQNVQDVVDLLDVTPSSDTEAYAALIEELADREDQLSSYVGSLFHTSELDVSTIVNPNLGDNKQNETISIYDPYFIRRCCYWRDRCD